MSPDNLVIGDMGLANTMKHYSENWDGAGTPGWMAPETNGTYSVHSQKADVFGLGAVLFFMITGSSPFKSDLGTSCFISSCFSAIKFGGMFNISACTSELLSHV